MCAPSGNKLIYRLEGRAGIHRNVAFCKATPCKHFTWNTGDASSLLHAVGGYEHSAVRGASAFFLSLVANLCAESDLRCPRCFVVWFIKGLEDTWKQLQLRAPEVYQSLVLAAWFQGVSSRVVTIKAHAVGLAPFVTAGHGWQVHLLSTAPCPLLPFIPVLPYSLSLASESTFLFLVACLRISMTLRGYKKSFGICSL